MQTGLLLLLVLAQGRSPDLPLKGPAANCGTEIPWTKSLDDAKARARKEGRPIAWWVTTLRGSPMDRKLVVRKYMLTGPFMMPEVVKLLSDHFVPLQMAGDMEHRKKFGLAPLDFIEPGFLFLDADLNVIHRVDRISTFSEEWFSHLLRGVLGKTGKEVPVPVREESAAMKSLREGRPNPRLFETLEGGEARYFHGVALHLIGRDKAGRAEWAKIKEGRWAWKAAAELARDGPFVRGFERYEKLPADALHGLPKSTTVARKTVDPRRAVRYLVQTQRGNGAWDDSHYHFGGDDSLPNVYMAITALATLALWEWGEDSADAKVAVLRAEAYMDKEKMIAYDDTDEIAWAHAYRLLYFARTKNTGMMARLVRLLGNIQRKSGIWYHEYSNPFVTATVLHVLDEAKKAGAEVPEAMLKRGTAALESCRNKTGVISYGFPGRGGRVEGSAGRMPLCEFALFLNGRSTPERVKESLKTSFKHHPLLETIRKYDDHADRYHNGGFFFWYDQYGRALASKAAGDTEALAKQREIVLSTQEIDGCWVDSHELGRVYGTAMALLTLRLTGGE